MKSYCLIFCLLISLTSCSYKVVRTGYKTPEKTDVDCRVVIKKKARISKDEATLLGEVRLKDTGFTTDCGEASAILTLKKEACSIGADLINITAEKYPGFSSCYRCEAKLYKSKQMVSDSSYVPGSNSSYGEYYNNAHLRDKQLQEKKRQSLLGLVIGSIAAGVLVGILLGS